MADYARKARLKIFYGLTPEQYDELLKAQKGVCATCGSPETAPASLINRQLGDRKVRRLAVDHDHKTKKIRGLLCRDCNVAIGLLNDDPDLMRCIAAYIDASRMVTP